ncbi:MAG: tyrosine-type recombinase/integrase [Candidatus Bathyarchaeota archaeon]|nr:tyrosine-type recombinase/integrase [Candidatus Bathyarchaeota archaeon]
MEKYLSGYSNPATKENYYSALLSYFMFIYPELQEIRGTRRSIPDRSLLERKLDEYSLGYFKVNRDYQYDLVSYRDWLVKHRAPKTLDLHIGVILGYLTEQGISFSKGFIRRLTPKGSSRAISDEKVPTGEELAKLLEHCSLPMKAIVLFLSSSGARIGETLMLRMSDLKLDHNPASAYFRMETTKTRVARKVYISSEAVAVLKEYLEYRPVWARSNAKQGHYPYDPEDDRLFPLQPVSFTNVWTTAINRAGFSQRDKRTRRLLLHPHNLRKYFRVKFGGSPDICEYLLGHAGPYTRFDQAPEIVEKEYLRCETNLSIFEQSKTVTELKQKVESQGVEMEGLFKSIVLKNVKLESEVDSLHKRFDHFEQEALTEDKIRAILFSKK